MKIEAERPSTDTIFDCEFDDQEWEVLLKHGNDNCPVEEVEAFYVNWAIVDILRRQLAEAGADMLDDQLDLFATENENA